jgi:sortase B
LRRRKNNTVKLILIVLCVILVCVFLYSGYRIISTLRGYKQAEETYNQVASQYAAVATPAAQTEPSPQPQGDGIDPEVSPLNIDFTGLRAQSKDYVGWIYCPNTKINYPIAYTDDNFYYLDHIPGDIENANGTIFIDCRNASDLSDKNTCIYGHNMNDGSMFASLRNYRDANYYPEHPVMYLSTPDFNYRLDLVAGFITEPTSFAYATNFDTADQFLGHIQLVKDLSTFQSDVQVSETDRIVTLSTCTYEYEDARYVVMCKIVPM